MLLGAEEAAVARRAESLAEGAALLRAGCARPLHQVLGQCVQGLVLLTVNCGVGQAQRGGDLADLLAFLEPHSQQLGLLRLAVVERRQRFVDQHLGRRD